MDQETKEASQEGTMVTPAQGNLVGAPPTIREVPAAGAPATYIYAAGHLRAYFSSRSVEKEFAQASGRAETAGQTDRQVLHNVLSQPQNRYLARQMLYVLRIQEQEAYIVIPGDPMLIDGLIEAIRPQQSDPIDVVIGRRGPFLPQELSNGLMIPTVIAEQLYHFERDEFLKAIPRPKNIAKDEFVAASREVLERILHMTDNAGATDEHRALNHAVFRYAAIHEKTAEQFARNFSLTGVEVRLSPLSGTRKIVDCIFRYTNRDTDFMEAFFFSTDVDGLFPFLVRKLAPYFDVTAR
jgi:PatG C-terminal